MKKQINTNTVEDRIALLDLLIKFGYKWHGGEFGCDTGEGIEKRYSFDNYPVIVVKPEYTRLAGNYGGVQCELQYPADTTKIIDYLLNRNQVEPIKIEGVLNYEVEVSPDFVQVGCQTIPVDKILEVAKVLNSLQ